MSNNDYVQAILSQHFKPIYKNINQAKTIRIMADIVRQLPVPDMKAISVIGGAASGKTTIAKELVEDLQNSGIKTDLLSTDDYVLGDRTYRQKNLKEADAKRKYDFELMGKHIQAIRSLSGRGKTIAVPEIDQETGIAVDTDRAEYPHEVGRVNVLVVEGDFPQDDYDLRFYLHVPDAQRLQNNLEREAAKENDATIGKLTQGFQDRQRTIHKPYTLPALQDADYVLEATITDEIWLHTFYKKEEPC